MEGKRKYLSEYIVNLYSARWLLLSANQLAADATMAPAEQAISDNCHIYLICTYPAAAYVKDSLRYADGQLVVDVRYKVRGEEQRLHVDMPFPLLDGAVALRVSDYPHREIQTVDAAGDQVRYLPASNVALGGRHQRPELGNLEVMYVGQAFGDGTRSAFERLKSHATLQKILADVQYAAPDDEVFLCMFEYAPYRIISQMDGTAKGSITDDRDRDRFFSTLEHPLSDREQTCLTEAALIRYFSPKYNELYRETFPSPNHKILAQCFQLDFSGLAVEIDTDELGLSLFSERVKPSMHHIAKINLWGHEERLGFFHLVDREGKVTSPDDLIS
jgi:hypothetical protein